VSIRIKKTTKTIWVGVCYADYRVLAVFAAFFIVVLPAFVIEFVRKIKADDPERFARISNELRLFRLGSKKREKVGV
jgi:hypothetical protein